MATLTKKDKQQLAQILDYQWHGVRKSDDDRVPFANYAGMVRIIEALGCTYSRNESGRHTIE